MGRSGSHHLGLHLGANFRPSCASTSSRVQGLQEHVSRRAVASSAPGSGTVCRSVRGATGTILHTLSPPAGLASELEFSPDGRLVVLSHGGTGVNIYDTSSGNEVARDTTRSLHRPFAFSADGRTMVGNGIGNGLVHLWDAVTKRWETLRPDGESEPPRAFRCVLTANGTRLALGADPFVKGRDSPRSGTCRPGDGSRAFRAARRIIPGWCSTPTADPSSWPNRPTSTVGPRARRQRDAPLPARSLRRGLGRGLLARWAGPRFGQQRHQRAARRSNSGTRPPDDS